MAIKVECICGATFEAADALAGGQTDCPECDRELMVPTREWNEGYQALLTKLDSGSEADRIAVYAQLRDLKSPVVLPALMRGVYDPSRAVVNAVLADMLRVGDFGRDQLLRYMNEGALTVSRLVAMVRESEQWECADILCDMIDAGKLSQGQTSEIVTLLGESSRPRCIPTLKALRKVYPNLSMMIDNALDRLRKVDEAIEIVPESAKKVDEQSVSKVQEMAASQRTKGRKGCLVFLLLLAGVPAIAAVGAFALWT